MRLEPHYISSRHNQKRSLECDKELVPGSMELVSTDNKATQIPRLKTKPPLIFLYRTSIEQLNGIGIDWCPMNQSYKTNCMVPGCNHQSGIHASYLMAVTPFLEDLQIPERQLVDCLVGNQSCLPISPPIPSLSVSPLESSSTGQQKE